MAIVLRPEDPSLQHLTLTLDVRAKADELYQARVVSIIDGDTLEVDLMPTDTTQFKRAGSTATLQSTRLIERVRLLGIDAPETKPGDHANQQCQYLGIDMNLLLSLAKLATFHLQYLCPRGIKLTLKTTSKARDDYGRILAGLFVGELCINRAMVEHGYAIAYQGHSDWEEYEEIETRARDAKRGIWGQYEEPYYPASASSKTYHRPGCSNVPKAGTRFNTVKEAKAKGFKPCLACIPDYGQV